MNPRKPRFSIAARRIWPLFVPYEGWPFDKVLAAAQGFVGKRVLRLSYGSRSVPKTRPFVVKAINAIDLGGKVYTHKDSGPCDATVVFSCRPDCEIPNGALAEWRIDAAELYESESLAMREVADKRGVVAEAFDYEWTMLVHEFNNARSRLDSFEEWERFFKAEGVEHPIKRREQRDFIERIRKCLRSFDNKTGGAK